MQLTTMTPTDTLGGSVAPCCWNSAPRRPATTIWVTNIQIEAMMSSLRRPRLSTKAIAPKVASTFTAQQRGEFSADHASFVCLPLP